MTQLAGPMAVAAFLAMLIAALRLSNRDDEDHGGSDFLISLPCFEYLFCHGIGALIPFLLYVVWPDTWRPLFTASPWLVGLIGPLVVNQLLKFDGLELPEATGPLSRFLDRTRDRFEHRMIVAEFVAMRRFIDRFATTRTLADVINQMSSHIPSRMPDERKHALLKALLNAKTVEEAMELYIRRVGKEAFLYVFDREPQLERVALAALPLFDEWENHQERVRIHERILVAAD